MAMVRFTSGDRSVAVFADGPGAEVLACAEALRLDPSLPRFADAAAARFVDVCVRHGWRSYVTPTRDADATIELE